VTIVEHVTELHLLREFLGDQSLHDPLTGLSKQRFSISRLEAVLGRAERDRSPYARSISTDSLSSTTDSVGKSKTSCCRRSPWNISRWRS
jgi:hypothetical protein